MAEDRAHEHEHEHAEHLTVDTVDFDRVQKVADRVHFAGIRMIALHTELFVGPDQMEVDWGSRASVGFDMHSSGWTDAQAGTFKARGGFIAISFDEDEDDSKEHVEPDDERDPRLAVEAVFELSYEIDSAEGLTDEDLEHFAYANATIHAWPYWRELAQSVTSRMGIPPLVVKTFRFGGGRSSEAED